MKELDTGLTLDEVRTPTPRGLTRLLNQNDPKPPFTVEEVEGALSDVDMDARVKDLLDIYTAYLGESGDEINGVPVEESGWSDRISRAVENDNYWFYIARNDNIDRLGFEDRKTGRRIPTEEAATNIARVVLKQTVEQAVVQSLRREISQP